jgi:hypothetical protein
MLLRSLQLKASAAAEAAELPIVEQLLGLIDRQALVPNRLRYVGGASVKRSALRSTLNRSPSASADRYRYASRLLSFCFGGRIDAGRVFAAGTFGRLFIRAGFWRRGF